MKRWLAACLCAVILFSLPACSANAGKSSGPYAEMTVSADDKMKENAEEKM